MQYLSSGPLSPKNDYSSPVDSLSGRGLGGPLYGQDASFDQGAAVGKQASDSGTSSQDGLSSAYGFNPAGSAGGYGNYSIQQTFDLGEASSVDGSHASNAGLNVSYLSNETGSPRAAPNALVGQPNMTTTTATPAQTPTRPTQGWMSSPAPSTVQRDVLQGCNVPGYSPAVPSSISTTPFGGYPSGLSAHPGVRRPNLPPSYGSSPTLKSARRSRQVTHGGGGGGSGGAGPSSVPPSPLGGKHIRTTSGDTESLGSRTLERAVSGPAAFSLPASREVSWYTGGSRTASGMSAFSDGSEMLMSPHLASQNIGPYGGAVPTHPSIDGFRYPLREGGIMLDGTGQITLSQPMQAYYSQMGGVHGAPHPGLMNTPELIPGNVPGNFTGDATGTMTPTMSQPIFVPQGQPDVSPYMHHTPVFSQGGFPSHARTQTLDTIAESDLPELETPPVDYPAMIPVQSMLPSQSTFQSVPYPPVPGMSCISPSMQMAQPAQWNPNFMAGGPSAIMPPLAPMRSTSYTMAPAAGMSGPAPPNMHHRSFSETAPRSDPIAPGAMSAIVAPPPATAPMPTYDPQTWNQSPGMEPFSGGRAKPEPITPTRKRTIYPPVGMRLRPGPKPKPKTPKNGKAAPGSATTASGGTAAGSPAGTIPPLPPSVFEAPTAPKSALATPNLPFSSATSGSVPMSQSLSAPLSTFSSGGLINPSTAGLPPSFYPANQASPTPAQATVDPQLVAQQQKQQQQEGSITFKLERQAGPLDRHNPPFTKEFIESHFASYFDLNEKGEAVRRFKCLIDDCQRTFPRKSAIKAHVQTHIGDKPYQCPSCDHAFVRQHDLKRHMTTHEGEKSHKCLCKQEFARSDALARHMQREICLPLRLARDKRIAAAVAEARTQNVASGTVIGPAEGMPHTLPHDMSQAPPPNMPMGNNGLGVTFHQAGGSTDASQMDPRPPQ